MSKKKTQNAGDGETGEIQEKKVNRRKSKNKEKIQPSQTTEVSEAPEKPQMSKKEQKRRYYRSATYLHLFTFITCFGLFIALTAKIANQSLMECQPLSVEGWVLLNDPAAGKMERKEFSLSVSSACTLAAMLDAAPSVYTSEKLEKYGELNFTFAHGQKHRRFFISQNGVRDTRGLKRHKNVSPEEIREQIQQAMNEKQLETTP